MKKKIISKNALHAKNAKITSSALNVSKGTNLYMHQIITLSNKQETSLSKLNKQYKI